MPGIAGDGSEDLPNRTRSYADIARYECNLTFDDSPEHSYPVMEIDSSGDYVRYDDHIKALRKAQERTLPADYLKQKLDNAYGELKIITDNFQLLESHHIRQLIELNAMIGNILMWQTIDKEEVKCKS